MKPSDDVVNLFQQFGAKPGPYQELARQQEHQLSRDRWPLVTAVHGAVAGDIPSVVRRGDGAGAAQAPVVRPNALPAAAPMRAGPAAWAQLAPVPVPAPEAIATPASSVEALPHPAHIASPSTPAEQAPGYRAATPVPPAPVAAAALASRSPLSGLAGLRSGAPVVEPPASAAGTLPADLPSVFARLAGTAAATPAAQQAVPAPVWQPRRGPYP